MFNDFLQLCMGQYPAYQNIKGRIDCADGRNYLTIMQNYATLFANRADYENLPDEFLEVTGKNRWWLLAKFFAPCVCWFKSEALGLQCLPVSGMSDFNIAGMPTKWKCFGANGKTFNKDEKNSVLMFNDYSFSIPFLKLVYNVELMLECDKTHRQNLHAQRQPYIIEIEEDEKKSANEFINKLKTEDTIVVRKRVKDKNGKRVDVPYNTQAYESGKQFAGDKLAGDYRYFDNRNLSMLGYNNENMEKKERLLVDEVNSNNSVVDSFYTTALECEKEAFEKINKMWGYNIQVVPRKLLNLKEEEVNEKSDITLQQTETVEKSTGRLEESDRA